MYEQIIRCPVCNKIVALEKGFKKEQIKSVNGISWKSMSYSIGGWGRGNSFINDFSGEVCDECFMALKTKIHEFIEIFNKRKNSCDEGICIYSKSENKPTRNNVSDVQEDELQSKRHKKSLLRLLPLFPRAPNF